MEKYTYYFNDKPLDVYVKSSSGKNLIIKVNSENQIIVSKPNGISISKLNEFIEKNLEWAYNIKEQKSKVDPRPENENFIYLFGEKIVIQVNEGFSSNAVKYKPGILYVLMDTYLAEVKDQLIDEFLERELINYILEKQKQFTSLMNTNSYKPYVENRTSTWGVNYGHEKKIVYNSKLIHYPKEVIDYVIVHELAHDFQRNHSPKFWSVVEKYCPEYARLRKKLKGKSKIDEDTMDIEIPTNF